MNRFNIPPNERSTPRYKVSKEARVIYPDKRGLVDVIVRDLSVDGARIQLKSSTDLSGVFNLYIPPEKKSYTAVVRWMKGDLVGLQFKGAPEAAGD